MQWLQELSVDAGTIQTVRMSRLASPYLTNKDSISVHLQLSSLFPLMQTLKIANSFSIIQTEKLICLSVLVAGN